MIQTDFSFLDSTVECLCKPTVSRGLLNLIPHKLSYTKTLLISSEQCSLCFGDGI